MSRKAMEAKKPVERVAPTSIRLDKFLKISRIIKRRSVASDACTTGHITVNGKEGKPGTSVKVGDILSDTKVQEEIGGGYDIVLANIVSDVIIALAPRVHTLVKPGGLFLCSGIIDTRAEEVKGKLLEAGLTILEERSSEGWFAFSCQ